MQAKSSTHVWTDRQVSCKLWNPKWHTNSSGVLKCRKGTPWVLWSPGLGRSTRIWLSAKKRMSQFSTPLTQIGNLIGGKIFWTKWANWRVSCLPIWQNRQVEEFKTSHLCSKHRQLIKLWSQQKCPRRELFLLLLGLWRIRRIVSLIGSSKSDLFL